MAVVAFDQRLADLIDLDARAERIATGYTFTEGPVWHHRERSLIFVDIDFGNPDGGAMYRWTEAGGAAPFRAPSQNSNGNTYDRQGRLITCVGGGRTVVRTSADGTIETLASSHDGRPLNAPNDVICTPAGDVIFTDPVIRRPDASPTAARSAVYRIDARDGALTLLTNDLETPNGLAMSDDGMRLYVDDTRRQHVRVWDVDRDGRLSNDRVFCELTAAGAPAQVAEFLQAQVAPSTTTNRAPDGMKLDARGNLYVAANRGEGIWVFDPAGALLGFIGVGEERSAFGEGRGGPSNLAWGDDDWRTLYVTAVTSVYRLPMKVAGQPVPVS
jgi:gluconolactonase